MTHVLSQGSTSNDVCLFTSLPLYSALVDSPYRTGMTKTIYFEVRLLPRSSPRKRSGLFWKGGSDKEIEGSVALGFVAPPYPTWRLPGWQRGSLGVHGDDGRRYVNDDKEGVDFTAPFIRGDTVGLGMTFSVPTTQPPAYPGSDSKIVQGPERQPLDVQVFFTRNGVRRCGWDLHEEIDIERAEGMPGGVTGLEGEHDLLAAVGIFGHVECDVLFGRADWMYRQ